MIGLDQSLRRSRARPAGTPAPASRGGATRRSRALGAGLRRRRDPRATLARPIAAPASWIDGRKSASAVTTSPFRWRFGPRCGPTRPTRPRLRPAELEVGQLLTCACTRASRPRSGYFGSNISARMVVPPRFSVAWSVASIQKTPPGATSKSAFSPDGAVNAYLPSDSTWTRLSSQGDSASRRAAAPSELRPAPAGDAFRSAGVGRVPVVARAGRASQPASSVVPRPLRRLGAGRPGWPPRLPLEWS